VMTLFLGKPKKAMAMTRVSRGAPWFPVELI